MGTDIALALVGCVVAVGGCVASVVVPVYGPGWHLRNLERHTERVETRRMRRVRRLIDTGRVSAATEPAKHNTLDFACDHWCGDVRPVRNDERNREFGGSSTRVDERRCVVCRPYTDDDSLDEPDHSGRAQGDWHNCTAD